MIHRWLGPVPMVTFQGEGDLGRRMRSALFDALNAGTKRVVLLGTDIPGVNVRILRDAFDALLQHDVVLGPSTDGGYWLVGLKHPIDLFQKIDWSTPRVLGQTLARARQLGLTVRLLKDLSDVDTPEDLTKWRPGENFPEVFLTVVIPTFNEEHHLHRSISSAKGPEVEVIVADGGSTDGTLRQAETLGARVIRSPLGRARQQNLGAAEARGETLLFLHADTLLPQGYLPRVFETLMAPGTVLGAFRFKTDFRRPFMRLVEWMTHLRATFLHLPYGDQAIFMRKTTFEKTGGFPVVPIGEDLLLVRRLIRRGKRPGGHHKRSGGYIGPAMENPGTAQNHLDQPTDADGHGHGDFTPNPFASLPGILLMDFLDLKMTVGLYNRLGSAFQSLLGR